MNPFIDLKKIKKAMQISGIFCLLLISVAEATFLIKTIPEQNTTKSLKKTKSWTRSSKHEKPKSNSSFKISYLPRETEFQRSTGGKLKNQSKTKPSHTGLVNVVSSIGGESLKNRKSVGSKRFVLSDNFSMIQAAQNAAKSKIFPSTEQKKLKEKRQAFQPSNSYKIKNQAKYLKAGTNLTIGDFVYVDLPLNQWTQFYFSEPGQLPYSRWNFDIESGQSCVLQVVDAYCTGDRFEATRLLDDGTEIELLSTPPVPFNPVIAAEIKAGSNVNCTPFTTDAETAWASSSWSKGQVALTPGSYKLILKSILAPYGSGGAFVKVACENSCRNGGVIAVGGGGDGTIVTTSESYCSYGNSNIKYVRQMVPYTQASATCQANGLNPLDVTTGTIAEAHKVLLNCAGVDAQAWISSYNGDSYGGAIGLSLHATLVSEVGAISATPDTSTLQGVLCQK